MTKRIRFVPKLEAQVCKNKGMIFVFVFKLHSAAVILKVFLSPQSFFVLSTLGWCKIFSNSYVIKTFFLHET